MTTRVLLAASALLAATLGPWHSASAVPIPVAPNELVLNFDFTGEAIEPPYTFVYLAIDLQGVSLPDMVFVNVYEDLDGQGTIAATLGPKITGFTLDTLTGSSVTDGKFSIGLSLQVLLFLNTSDLLLAQALATQDPNGIGPLVAVDGTPSTTPVPEPALLILLGLGFGAAVLWRQTI